jgi:release factor glutamine methyltransferase
VVDVGTGSGAIAISLALETTAHVFATDISTAALQVAQGNARHLSANVGFLACDLIDAFPDLSVNVLVSNPPYVPRTDQPSLQREVRDYEPPVALFGGPTGLEIYERLTVEASRVLRPHGWLLFELGYNSLDPVRAMLEHDWSDIDVIPDLAGFPRVLAARLLWRVPPEA